VNYHVGDLVQGKRKFVEKLKIEADSREREIARKIAESRGHLARAAFPKCTISGFLKKLGGRRFFRETICRAVQQDRRRFVRRQMTIANRVESR